MVDRCIVVLNHEILGTGGYWPLVAAPCAPNGPYQNWRSVGSQIQSTDLPDRCIVILNHEIPYTGGYWPLVAAPCAPNGLYQGWVFSEN